MDCGITDFGARVSDRLQTAAIQAAIDACFLGGGGTVTVPCGVFRTGGIRLRSGVTLYLKTGAYLEGSDDPEDYASYLADTLEPPAPSPFESRSANPYSRWNNGLIKAVDAHDIAIVGEIGSYIDGVDCADCRGRRRVSRSTPYQPARMRTCYPLRLHVAPQCQLGTRHFSQQRRTHPKCHGVRRTRRHRPLFV